jgi:transcriptional regulator with XRE-family HTH domain
MATESLGSTLRRLRERADLSQEELAAKAQVSRASIQNWEADRRAPRRAESRRLAAALGVSDITPQESADELAAVIEARKLLIDALSLKDPGEMRAAITDALAHLPEQS